MADSAAVVDVAAVAVPVPSVEIAADVEVATGMIAVENHATVPVANGRMLLALMPHVRKVSAKKAVNVHAVNVQKKHLAVNVLSKPPDRSAVKKHRVGNGHRAESGPGAIVRPASGLRMRIRLARARSVSSQQNVQHAIAVEANGNRENARVRNGPEANASRVNDLLARGIRASASRVSVRHAIAGKVNRGAKSGRQTIVVGNASHAVKGVRSRARKNDRLQKNHSRRAVADGASKVNNRELSNRLAVNGPRVGNASHAMNPQPKKPRAASAVSVRLAMQNVHRSSDLHQ